MTDDHWHALSENLAAVKNQQQALKSRMPMSLQRILVVTAAVALVGCLLPLGLFVVNELGFESRWIPWSTLGQIGDTFGAANALVSSAALFAAVYAVVMQARALELMQLESQAQTIELEMTAVSHRSSADSQRATLAAAAILPLVDEISDRSNREARQFVSEMIRAHLSKRIEPKTLREFRDEFRKGLTSSAHGPWLEAVSEARLEFRALRNRSIESVSTSSFQNQSYSDVQDHISKCARTCEKVLGLWKAGVIGSDAGGTALAQMVISRDVAALLAFQYRPLAAEQRSERMAEEAAMSIPAVNFALALYSNGGLTNFKEATLHEVPIALYGDARP